MLQLYSLSLAFLTHTSETLLTPDNIQRIFQAGELRQDLRLSGRLEFFRNVPKYKI